ncbi:hypothetical protein [Aquipuribacter nitratireducens]|uniref:Uncharacterized protein n=1 Tax=Aquipuribacter nitratireducens TaxID=650104 RepID=A0ABW0GHT2_9MICO
MIALPLPLQQGLTIDWTDVPVYNTVMSVAAGVPGCSCWSTSPDV